jgi:hypothetical protein
MSEHFSPGGRGVDVRTVDSVSRKESERDEQAVGVHQTLRRGKFELQIGE